MSTPRAIVHQVHGLAAPQPRTVLVVASQSGGNGSVLEPGQPVTGRGHHPAAVTSAEHTARVHARCQRLADIADVVPDHGTAYGDALLPTRRRRRGLCDLVGHVCAGGAAAARRGRTTVPPRGGGAPYLPLPERPRWGRAHHALGSRYAGRVRHAA